MKRTEQWIIKNTRIADFLPESDISGKDDDYIRRNYEHSYVPDLKDISDRIPKEVADQISKKYPSLNFLGNGYFGAVYRNNDRPGWLIKVTTDETEFLGLKKIEMDGWKPKQCIVPTGECYEIEYTVKNTYGKDVEKRVGVIETKEIERLNDFEKDWANRILRYLGNKRRGNNWNSILNRKQLKEFIDMKYGSRISNELDEGGYDIFEKYMELAVCLGNDYNIDDMHSDNIGKKEDGRYYLIDLGLLVKPKWN